MTNNEIPQSASKKEIEWTPLLIVIGAAYLISLSMAVLSAPYGDSFDLERDLSIILSFLASTSLIVTIALVVFSRVDMAKKVLIVGMIILICLLAIRTEVYLRAL